ncbi:MAG: MoaD/ThiS family protein [Mycobacteriaceae bacterium]|nr:MoaD/ThiS family protein [Mycobacteriaceae bacterium]
MAESSTGLGREIQVTVRYFAAAREAAGLDAQTLTLQHGTTMAELRENLATQNPRLAVVLRRCSYLCRGIAVRDLTMALSCGDTVDVLPPFAGG